MPSSDISSPTDDGHPEAEVHIWTARPDLISAPASIAHLRSLLDDGESRRMHAFRFASDAHHYLVAHAMLRLALAAHSGRDPRSLQFVTPPGGKPALADPPPGPSLEFNLTHTAGLVACAIAQRVVGIDAESANRGLDLSVAERVLTPSELAGLTATPQPGRHHRFLLHWTLKEAYVKARGSGLTADLQSFGFSLDASLPPRFHPPQDDLSENWEFMQTPDTSDTGIPLAVAVKKSTDSPPARFHFHAFSPHA